MYPATVLCALLCLMPLASVADLERRPDITGNGRQFYYQPKILAPAGWHLDAERSAYFHASALAPDGADFTDATTVMYAKAIPRRTRPELKSLSDLIARDERSFEHEHPGILVHEVAALPTADGRRLRTFTFSPDKDEGNWEQISYDEEGDFFLIFAISSRTLDGYLAAVPAYGSMIGSYRHGR